MKKGTDTERRDGQQQPTEQGQGAGQKESSEATLLFFLKGGGELLELSFDFLFPDSPCGSFCCDNFHGGSIHQQSWDQSPLDAFPSEAHFGEKALALH